MPKVRFYVNTPVCFSAQKPYQPLMLDGLLGYAWALRKGLLKNPGESVPSNLIFPELPLELAGDRCYAASAAFVPSEASLALTYFNRRADWKEPIARAGAPQTSYNVSVGAMQAGQEPYWLLVTPYLDFYYQATDQAEVNALLDVLFRIRFLGSKRAAGFGLIRHIRLIKDAEDWAVWRNGVPTRPVPVAIAGKRAGLTPEWCTYYPPYWAAANRVWCYVPSADQSMPRMETSGAAVYFTERVRALRERMAAREADDAVRTRGRRKAGTGTARGGSGRRGA